MKTDPVMGTSAAIIIALLDLRPHPEGGYFRETFRDPARDSRGRAVSTLIYFLLEAGQLSRWASRGCGRGLAFLRRGAVGNKNLTHWRYARRASLRPRLDRG
jgi:predicted cupin superfamily sugar epimerase